MLITFSFKIHTNTFLKSGIYGWWCGSNCHNIQSKSFFGFFPNIFSELFVESVKGDWNNKICSYCNWEGSKDERVWTMTRCFKHCWITHSKKSYDD